MRMRLLQLQFKLLRFVSLRVSCFPSLRSGQAVSKKRSGQKIDCFPSFYSGQAAALLAMTIASGKKCAEFFGLHRKDRLIALIGLSFFLAACQLKPSSAVETPAAIIPDPDPTQTSAAAVTETPAPELTSTPLPRQLSICLGREPKSLFLYDAVSSSAKSVLAAIYDGPFDRLAFQSQPVILEKLPSLQDGDVLFEPVSVAPGQALVDAYGNLNTLAEGVLYRPSGCFEQACAQAYAGGEAAQLDQWVIRFRLKGGVSWSDGNPLKADDSVYSYEVAEALYPAALPTLVQRTQTYQPLDDQTVEWRGVPGYLDGDIAGKFFSPLPRLAWAALKAEDLRTAEISTRQPLGWGAYQVVEWVGGDHITLQKNPFYFRSAEGLPAFDIITFRFVGSGSEAVEALVAGECDLVDPNAAQDVPLASLADLQNQGALQMTIQPNTAWEQLTFGISPLDDQRPRFFASAEVRRATALCLDRPALAAPLFAGKAEIAQAYLAESNPLFNAEAPAPAYDPAKAAELLASAGWLDLDNNPQTPRTSQGVAGLPDNVLFQVDYLVSLDEKQQAAAKQIQAALAACGIGVNIVTQDLQEYLAPGPEGPVFGRKFEMAQFAWSPALEPPCYLFSSDEIPGPYPEAAKGWGGVNASGYVNPAYDRLCRDGRFTLPEMAVHAQAYRQAQGILAEEVPAIPLYWHFKVLLTRPDVCGVSVDASTMDPFWNVEVYNYGEECK
jgi:peptide/nickel transport system substrate-binding protein